LLTDNGNEFGRPVFTQTLAALNVRHSRIKSGCPQTNVTSSATTARCLMSAGGRRSRAFCKVRYRGLQRQLHTSVDFYNFQRAHTGRITQGRVPAELVYGARKMEPR
jgi:hypothetical protein